MTRTGDKWVCYADRNAAVRKQDPDMFIAIHCDSSSTASAMGTSAYYYRAYSQPLAKALHQSIVAAYKSDIYADKPDSFKNKVSRGANFYAFRVTRVEECPAVLIEYGFVSNTDECQVLQNAKNRDTLAKATVEGIKKYISAS
jgi:N-acetylmuramoyl-L-alanine amidase